VADLLYCGSPPVGPDSTAALLEGAFSAIWAPPMGIRTTLAAGDRIWLVWRELRSDPAMLLGTGHVLPTPAGDLAWTNRSAPGIRQAALDLGYSGPANMSFLRLGDVRIVRPFQAVDRLRDLPTGLSAPTPRQLEGLANVAAAV